MSARRTCTVPDFCSGRWGRGLSWNCRHLDHGSRNWSDDSIVLFGREATDCSVGNWRWTGTLPEQNLAAGTCRLAGFPVAARLHNDPSCPSRMSNEWCPTSQAPGSASSRLECELVAKILYPILVSRHCHWGHPELLNPVESHWLKLEIETPRSLRPLESTWTYPEKQQQIFDQY